MPNRLNLTRWTPVFGVVLLAVLAAAVTGLFSVSNGLSPQLRSLLQAQKNELHLQRIPIPQGILYYMVVPADSGARVVPLVSESLQPITDFATDSPDEDGHHPLLVINGGYFDPTNQQTASYVTINAETVLDPTTNARLTDNKALAPYLPKIFNRSEFRTLRCQKDKASAITRQIAMHDAAAVAGCEMVHALGAGPQLLPSISHAEEGFTDTAPGNPKRLTRDPIGINRRNARSAIGLTEKGDVIIVMVGQDPERPKLRGVSLIELATILQSLGATSALNLDGGSSSSIVYGDTAYYGKLSRDGEPVKRRLKSVLAIYR